MNNDERLNQESANSQESNPQEETINSESSKNTVDTETNESSSAKSTNEESDKSKKIYQPGYATKIVLEVCLIIIIITVMVAIIPGIYRTSKNWFKTAEDTSGLVASASADLRDVGTNISSNTKDVVNKASDNLKELVNTVGSNTTDFAIKVSDNTKEVAVKGVDLVKDGVKEPLTLISGEKQATDSIDLPPETPVASYNPSIATVSTEMEYTEIVVKEEKMEYVEEFLFNKNQQAKFIRNFERDLNRVIATQTKEAKAIFDKAISRIPSFVNSHYEERSNSSLIVSLMEKELLPDETLEIFLVNTAQKIDDLFFDSVNTALNDALISIDLGTDTVEELRKRLPTAREICNQIYIDLINKKDPLTNKPKYTDRVNDLGNIYDNWKLKHPVIDGISKVAFVSIIGYLFPLSLYVTVPALLTDIVHTAKINKVKNDFELELKNQFYKQSRNYENNLKIAIKDIAKCYVDLVIKAKIKGIKTDNGDSNNKYSIEFPTRDLEYPKQ